ncbi:hypothetical protein D3C81_2299220 [compost metagenome]
MGLVDNQHVVFAAEQQFFMRITLGGIHGGDHNVVAPGVGFFLGYRGNPEFVVQLTHPLQHQ